MKFVLTLIFIICASLISYSQTAEESKKPAPPKISFKNVESQPEELKTEVLDKIISPLICESDKPIEEIVVDFCPKLLFSKDNELGCNNKLGKSIIAIAVIGFMNANSVRPTHVTFLVRSKDNSFDYEDYLKASGAYREIHRSRKNCVSNDQQER